jgi:L-asparaginase
VLFTGGTIGSKTNGSTLDASKSATPQLIDLFKSECPNCNVSFSYETLFNVLSENMTVLNWKEMYNRIMAISKRECDGIIVTHGTDTLAYTSTFLSFMLNKIDVPVLLLSSDYPIDDKRTNGLHNFVASVKFITNVRNRGVFVPFWKNGKTKIHLGSRLLQACPFSHCFRSLGNVEYGYMINGEFEKNTHENNAILETSENRISIPRFPIEKRVLFLKPYLGMDYSVFGFNNNKPDVIIHELYHSGTACTDIEFEKNSIVVFAKYCIELGIDFYAAPCDSRHNLYSTTKEMDDAGIKFIKDVSCVAAYTKLLIAYGSFDNIKERQDFLNSNIACEQFYS